MSKVMRWLFPLLALLGSTEALASKLIVETDRPVIIVVNFVPHTVGANNHVTVDIDNSKSGNQGVTIRNMLGEQVWSAKVLVGKNEKVTCRWRGRAFEIYKREEMKAKAPRSRPRQPSREDLLRHKTPGLKPPPPLEEDVHLAAVEAADGLDGGTPAAHQIDAAPVAIPDAGAVGKVLFVGRTTSWSNLYVDGALLKEFRGEREWVAELETGAHDVVVKDFQDNHVWAQSQVLVYPDFQVELHFGQANPPAALNREEAWTDAP